MFLSARFSNLFHPDNPNMQQRRSRIRKDIRTDSSKMTFLEYKDNQFHECSGTPATQITLKVDNAMKKLILTVPSGASMIERRAAERNARSIQKSGYQTARMGRSGRDYELDVGGGGGGLPDKLRHSPREVY